MPRLSPTVRRRRDTLAARRPRLDRPAPKPLDSEPSSSVRDVLVSWYENWKDERVPVQLDRIVWPSHRQLGRVGSVRSSACFPALRSLAAEVVRQRVQELPELVTLLNHDWSWSPATWRERFLFLENYLGQLVTAERHPQHRLSVLPVLLARLYTVVRSGSVRLWLLATVQPFPAQPGPPPSGPLGLTRSDSGGAGVVGDPGSYRELWSFLQIPRDLDPRRSLLAHAQVWPSAGLRACPDALAKLLGDHSLAANLLGGLLLDLFLGSEFAYPSLATTTQTLLLLQSQQTAQQPDTAAKGPRKRKCIATSDAAPPLPRTYQDFLVALLTRVWTEAHTKAWEALRPTPPPHTAFALASISTEPATIPLSASTTVAVLGATDQFGSDSRASAVCRGSGVDTVYVLVRLSQHTALWPLVSRWLDRAALWLREPDEAGALDAPFDTAAARVGTADSPAIPPCVSVVVAALLDLTIYMLPGPINLVPWLLARQDAAMSREQAVIAPEHFQAATNLVHWVNAPAESATKTPLWRYRALQYAIELSGLILSKAVDAHVFLQVRKVRDALLKPGVADELGGAAAVDPLLARCRMALLHYLQRQKAHHHYIRVCTQVPRPKPTPRPQSPFCDHVSGPVSVCHPTPSRNPTPIREGPGTEGPDGRQRGASARGGLGLATTAETLRPRAGTSGDSACSSHTGGGPRTLTSLLDQGTPPSSQPTWSTPTQPDSLVCTPGVAGDLLCVRDRSRRLGGATTGRPFPARGVRGGPALAPQIGAPNSQDRQKDLYATSNATEWGQEAWRASHSCRGTCPSVLATPAGSTTTQCAWGSVAAPGGPVPRSTRPPDDATHPTSAPVRTPPSPFQVKATSRPRLTSLPEPSS